MPETAKLIDEWKKVIPGIKVLYAEEGQYKLGNREGSYVQFRAFREEDDGSLTKSDRRKRKAV